MNTLLQERLIAVALERNAYNQARKAQATPLRRVPSRFSVKQERKHAAKVIRAIRHEHSMMHAGQPKGHRPVYQNDDRTRLMMAMHIRRVERAKERKFPVS